MGHVFQVLKKRPGRLSQICDTSFKYNIRMGRRSQIWGTSFRYNKRMGRRSQI
jgi:hypothetical protein